MDCLSYFADTHTVRIATERVDGKEVVTPIWAVVVDGAPYVRNGYGAGSMWFRRVQRTRRAVFVGGPDRCPVAVEPVHDKALNDKVDEAYRAKYAGQGAALRQMVSPQAREYTLRLIPRKA